MKMYLKLMTLVVFFGLNLNNANAMCSSNTQENCEAACGGSCFVMANGSYCRGSGDMDGPGGTDLHCSGRTAAPTAAGVAVLKRKKNKFSTEKGLKSKRRKANKRSFKK